MGVFLIKFHENNPKKFNFFLKYKTNLDVSDADIAVMRNKNKGYKELIVSFKTVVENTYNVNDIGSIVLCQHNEDEEIYGVQNVCRSHWGSLQSFSSNMDLFLARSCSGIQRLFYGSYDPLCDEMNEFL